MASNVIEMQEFCNSVNQARLNKLIKVLQELKYIENGQEEIQIDFEKELDRVLLYWIMDEIQNMIKNSDDPQYKNLKTIINYELQAKQKMEKIELSLIRKVLFGTCFFLTVIVSWGLILTPIASGILFLCSLSNAAAVLAFTFGIIMASWLFITPFAKVNNLYNRHTLYPINAPANEPTLVISEQKEPNNVDTGKIKGNLKKFRFFEMIRITSVEFLDFIDVDDSKRTNFISNFQAVNGV